MAHLSFDLTQCSQTIDDEGRVTKQPIHGIPFTLDETHLGGSRRLFLKGAIISSFHEDLGNEYLTLFQKENPRTRESQWFLANGALVRPISKEDAAALMPNAIHLYYDNPHAIVDITSASEGQLSYTPEAARAKELKQILEELYKLRIEVEEPKSWLEELGEAFHGTGGLMEIENGVAREKLLDIHQKLEPLQPAPAISSSQELAHLHKKLIRRVREELITIERSLQQTQKTHLEYEERLAEWERRPTLMQRVRGAFNLKPTPPIEQLAKIIDKSANPSLFV